VRVPLAPLEPASLSAIVGGAGELAELAGGSIARYQLLRDAGGLDLHRRLAKLTGGLPRLDLDAAHDLLDGLGGSKGRARFRTLSDLLLAWLEASVRATVLGQGTPAQPDIRPLPGQLARWIELWEKTARSITLAETYNLDPKQTLLPAFVEMAEIARR
jgi:DNA polymerase-3 subunit delta'